MVDRSRAGALAVVLVWHGVSGHRPPPPSRAHATHAASTTGAAAVPPIFCNRAVNLGRMEAIGFDMDHTLAQYKAEPFDQLAYRGAINKLIGLGYPPQIAGFEYDITRYQRGLVIDRARGNVLKMDRHKYVKVAQHGMREMDPEERKELYDRSRPSFDPPDFTNIDTAFMLVDVCLYCQLVDLKDSDAPGALGARSYAQIYSDVRRAVDLCHCDGVIKDDVMRTPADFIDPDSMMGAMLTRIRSAGQTPFLVTNSAWEYTDAVMTYLLGGERDGAAAFGHADWTGFFDVIIVGARKPAFLLDSNLPIFRVRQSDGSLLNLENAEFASAASVAAVLRAGKVFQGGNWNHLHKLVGLSSVDRLLYVGDHMYSDVLRAKRSLGWRTMLVVPELDKETRVRKEHSRMREAIQDARDELLSLERELADLELIVEPLVSPAPDAAVPADAAAQRDVLGGALAAAKATLAERVLAYHRKFHPHWGQLFKTGYQNSRFAQQVENYACLYAARASHLGFYSPRTRFHTIVDEMPHDRHERSSQP
ncbi:hypothetical protein KFE25_006288 [Diacronema lutheri]|uniref:5'-nucleotidase n=2 Tax=Diacronema lutheri TaxID=2081491 RepID=A0A8J5XKN9_DIALT|nr:hypothetical protein KFE25_006288 [Diacronema lutheri]